MNRKVTRRPRAVCRLYTNRVSLHGAVALTEDATWERRKKRLGGNAWKQPKNRARGGTPSSDHVVDDGVRGRVRRCLVDGGWRLLVVRHVVRRVVQRRRLVQRQRIGVVHRRRLPVHDRFGLVHHVRLLDDRHVRGRVPDLGQDCRRHEQAVRRGRRTVRDRGQPHADRRLYGWKFRSKSDTTRCAYFYRAGVLSFLWRAFEGQWRRRGAWEENAFAIYAPPQTHLFNSDINFQ